ncbi:MAG TPA: FHA domain-containing protein [Mycobacteriales bacterium]|nr:FHA domain-containing protein [Mycobacteriales bacterium]
MPVAVVFLLRTVVLILLWGFVIAAVVAVRHDIFGTAPRRASKPARATRGPAVAQPPPPPKPKRARASRQAVVPPTRVAIVDGPLAGKTVPLSSLPVTIGRAESSTIAINDDYVSQHHARLVPNGSVWLIEDLGSTNGTLLGSSKITTPTEVSAGARIRIGRTLLELQA